MLEIAVFLEAAAEAQGTIKKATGSSLRFSSRFLIPAAKPANGRKQDRICIGASRKNGIDLTLGIVSPRAVAATNLQ